MANSPESLSQQYTTVRSISLPSRLHPNGIRIEAELRKLKQWEASSVSITEPLSGEAIQAGLVRLAELYNCTQELMSSSTIQQALLQYQNGILVEQSLDGSIELLDSCSAIRDLFSTIKGHGQELQSALRRKNGDPSLTNDITAYLSFRKKMKRDAAKSLKILKQIESRLNPAPIIDVSHKLATVIRMLREVTSITMSILRSLLVSLYSSPASSSKNGWSLISKLMITNPTASSKDKGHAVSNIECVDLALTSLHGRIRHNGEGKAELQMVKTQLQMVDSRIEGLDAGLECLFRQLVRHRVTLLNMLTH